MLGVLVFGTVRLQAQTVCLVRWGVVNWGDPHGDRVDMVEV